MTARSPDREPGHGAGGRVQAPWRRSVYTVVGAQFAIQIAFGFTLPFMPLFIEDLGIHERTELSLWIGLTVGITGLIQALVLPGWGALADRFGHKLMVARSYAGLAVGFGAAALAGSVWQVFAARAFQGVFGGAQAASITLVAAHAPPERIAQTMGAMNVSIQVGNLAGPLIGAAVAAVIGYRGGFALAAALCLASFVLTTVVVRETPHLRAPEARPRLSTRDALKPFGWRALRASIAVQFASQVVNAATFAFLSVYALDLPRPAWMGPELLVGLALALAAAGSVLATPLLSWWCARTDARLALGAAVALYAVALLGQALQPDPMAFLALRAAGGAALAGMSISNAIITRAAAASGREGAAFGATLSASTFGFGLGPFVGSALVVALGVVALYFASAIGALALLVLIVARPTWFPRAARRTDAPAG